MKSSDSQLKSRGKITFENLQHYNNHSEIELLEIIKSKEAYKRTIAIRLLSEKNDLNHELIHLFLQTLTQENKLYTKIELCDALSKGNVQSAKIMVEYLGQIGNNQQKVLPTNGFNKKSYPLPRDIIARTLAHMKKEILPVLLDVLKTDNTLAIREVIDAIGFMCFYNKIHSDNQIIDVLLLCLKTNYKDDITRWKLVRAFESFNTINVIQTLMDIERNDNQPIVRNEAKRSLEIIINRTEN
ncbi:MAG TPA: HEAT repeat domain-containing protein [Sporosarcina psychrophila]|uniref:HEAT repeat domain-containing protein n=1 Tax=Sporosarcina psychrophila TaxID=1476 RepID=A0A921FZU5_SPOPS|nr:HEAT repeat domain-containing protein [Sporosarcina psychrophila]